MKKILLSIFAVMLAVFSVQAEEVTFDFTSPSTLSPSFSMPESGSGIDINGAVFTEGVVNFTATNGSTNTRFWNSSGDCDFRVYKTAVITISVPEGYIITGVSSTGTTINWGVGDNSNSVQYTATATLKIKTVTVTYEANAGEGSGETPEPEEPETPTTSAIVATYELTQENMASEWSGTTSYENKTIECSYGSWTGYFNFTKSGTTYALGLNGNANLQSPVSYGAVKSVSIVITNASSSARNIVLTGGAESKTISVPSKTTTEVVFDGFETEFYSFTLTASGALQISSIKVVCPPSYTLSVSDAGWATMFLCFDAEIFDGAKAYIVKTEGVSADKVTLTEITGTIPANTGVIVKVEPGLYEFNYSAENVADVAGNLLEGTAAATEIDVEAYVLGNVDGVGLYKAKMAGGVWLNNANKAYLPASVVPNKSAAFYGFDWEGTTGVSEVKGESGNVKTIYDLTGRRVETITEPGIYIVNGVKKLVR